MSDPSRFLALHAVGLDLLRDLEEAYDVVREPLPAPAVGARLVPSDPAAAPLTVELLGMPEPGLRLSGGSWAGAVLPHCGCDACDETTEESDDALRRWADALVAATSGQRLRWSWGWWYETWETSRYGSSSGRERVRGARLRELRERLGPGRERRAVAWPLRPLPPRPPAPPRRT